MHLAWWDLHQGEEAELMQQTGTCVNKGHLRGETSSVSLLNIIVYTEALGALYGTSALSVAKSTC